MRKPSPLKYNLCKCSGVFQMDNSGTKTEMKRGGKETDMHGYR